MNKTKVFRKKFKKFLDGFSKNDILFISCRLEIYGCYKTVKSRKIALLNYFKISNKSDYKYVCQLIWQTLIV